MGPAVSLHFTCGSVWLKSASNMQIYEYTGWPGKAHDAHKGKKQEILKLPDGKMDFFLPVAYLLSFGFSCGVCVCM